MNGRRMKPWIAAAAVGYVLLLCLLVWAESRGEGALIDSFPKALWYSLVTVTTVGYGDLYPVTLPGRLIGLVFLLLSTGLLALLVGFIFSAFTGRLFPRFRLWRRRRDKWYVFCPDNEASRALAAALTDGLTVFCGAASAPAGSAVSLDMSPEALFELPYAADGERCFFAMDDAVSSNDALAAALRERDVRIYCRSDGPDEGLPANVTTFGDAECAARLYWQSQPWSSTGERAALIGNGRYARALLLQGLLTAPPDCEIDVFGDWSAWLGIHGDLSGVPDAQFCLRFHPEGWQACPDTLKAADRVVLCADDAGTNREALFLLRRYYVLRGSLHARCPEGLQPAWYFGDAQSVFTPELVMKRALDARARQLHALYRAGADYPVPPWDALPDFLKRSNLAAADHLLTKLRLLLPEEDVREITPDACRRAADRYDAADAAFKERCRIIEHARWCLFHALYNWRYAPVRDNAERLHPMLVTYDKLDEVERAKDDNAWLLLRQLSGTPEKRG